MNRFTLALPVLLGIVAQALADPVTAIIPVSAGHPGPIAASGFRDIPPGGAPYYELSIQSNGGGLYYSNINAAQGEVVWVPQSDEQGAAVHVFVTTGPGTEDMVGVIVSGTTSFMPDGSEAGGGSTDWYTSNVYYSDAYDNSGNFPGGPYYDCGMHLPATDSSSLPTSLPGSYMGMATSGGIPHPGFSFPSSGSGRVWFSSNNSAVAVYRLDAASNTWVRADQAFLVTPDTPLGACAARATLEFAAGGTAQIKIYYVSVDSVNAGADGDTIDILNARGDNPPNFGR
jgi:hypothetical protein